MTAMKYAMTMTISSHDSLVVARTTDDVDGDVIAAETV
jgi:hypothetical protein